MGPSRPDPCSPWPLRTRAADGYRRPPGSCRDRDIRRKARLPDRCSARWRCPPAAGKASGKIPACRKTGRCRRPQRPGRPPAKPETPARQTKRIKTPARHFYFAGSDGRRRWYRQAIRYPRRSHRKRMPGHRKPADWQAAARRVRPWPSAPLRPETLSSTEPVRGRLPSAAVAAVRK